ncbi:hypothetical protein PC121_g5052 [Phytophthora cactorum]|nr:hypothetical protein PC120_g2761 [Phytophthora cactorum]KAG3085897.1 hypothetical protein PC121_g5052 [Phytophthora cactorum]
MKVQAAFASVISLASLGKIVSANPSWHDLAIPAPHYGRYLFRPASEEPFLWQADAAWELFHRLNKTSIDFYLKTVLNKATTSFKPLLPLRERHGAHCNELPFTNEDETPNEAFFELADWAVDLAASYGILMTLVPTWGMYVNGWRLGQQNTHL